MKSEYWNSLAGGVVIGLACTAYLFLLGRVAGISGMVGRVVSGKNIWPDAAFLAGLAAGPVVWSYATGNWPELSLNTPWYVLLPAGFFVGYGTRLGSGLILGGMANPATVRSFLDLAGDWNPSLVFVLGGAVTVASAGVALQKRLARPVLEPSFQLPTARQIDAPLMAGSCLFGVGWGLSGFCPGPAVLSIFVGHWPSLVFVAGLLLGTATYGARMGKVNTGKDN
ncbi:hypothetical protein KL907_003665 [Ogataea polymorpha]|nr:hypothetical protein KL907_003665 [Ogataea polymorpha]